jgi:hypothetical protein
VTHGVVVASSRVVELATISGDDILFLYELALRQDTGPRWRFRGAAPPIDAFVSSLWNGVAAQFVVKRRNSGERVGHVVSYGMEERDGYCYFGIAFVPEVWSTTVTMIGTMTFLTWLFDTYPLRKVCAEVPHFNYTAVKKGEGKYFETSGVLSDHVFAHGTYWDVYLLTFWRKHFLEEANQVKRVLGID